MLFRPQVEGFLRYNRSVSSDEINVDTYVISRKHVEETLRDPNPDLCYQIDVAADFALVLNPQWLETASLAAPPPALSAAPPAPGRSAKLKMSRPAESSPFRAGQLDYEIPDMMVQGKFTTCIIRIGDIDVKNMTISSVSVHAPVEICDEMSVKLIDLSDGENFKLMPIGTERQSIEKGVFTEWKIGVKPLLTGAFPLVLCISCHANGRTKDVKVLEKLIVVNADPMAVRRKKIVFIAAGSKSGLLLGKESNEIWDELRLADFRDDFSYVKYFEVSNLQFNRALSYEKPSIVHFSGHGSVEGIFLADERGEPQLASRQDMAGLFRVLQTDDSVKIECVVLNACLSRDLAEELSNSVSVVIGTNTKIGDDKAIQFSEFFYRALGNRRTYQQAFDSGRLMVSPDDGNATEDDELLMCIVK